MKWNMKVRAMNMFEESMELLEEAEENLESCNESYSLSVSPANFSGFFCLTNAGDHTAQYGRILSIEREDGTEEDISVYTQKYTESTRSIRITEVDGNVLTCEITEEEQKGNMTYSSVLEEARAIMEQKIKEGIRDREDAEDVLEYLLSQKVDDYVIRDAVSWWEKHEGKVEKPKCLYVDSFLETSMSLGEDGVIAETITHLTNQYGVLVESEKGLGKGVLTDTTAWILNLPIYRDIFSREMSRGQVYGDHLTDNSASDFLETKEAYNMQKDALDGDTSAAAKIELKKAQAAAVKIVIDKSKFYRCLSDHGMLAIDEINLGDPNLVKSIFNPLLDGNAMMSFPGLGDLKFERPSCIMATQNVGDEYVGTMDQDDSTITRFKFVKLQYPETLRDVIEAAAYADLKRRGFPDLKIKEEHLFQASKFYDTLYASKQRGLIKSKALNVRGFVSALVEVTKRPTASLKQYIRGGVTNACDDAEQTILRQLLNDTVTL